MTDPSFEERWAGAEADHATVEVTRTIMRFDEPGDSIVGVVLEIEPFQEGKFETEVKCYIVETDEGIRSMVFGSATDKQLADVPLVGQLIRATFHGKTELADGRSVNRFSVEVAGVQTE